MEMKPLPLAGREFRREVQALSPPAEEETRRLTGGVPHEQVSGNRLYSRTIPD